MKDEFAKGGAQQRMNQEQNFYRRGSNIFKPGVPGLKYYKTPDGPNLIDILPYFSGEYDPISSGTIAHKLILFIHPKLSQTGEDIICMNRTFKGLRGQCAGCEELQRKMDSGASEEDQKRFRPASWPRGIYNVYDRLKPGDGAQVWNASTYLFQQYLEVNQRRAQIPGEPIAENFIEFFDPSINGRSIAFDKQGKEELTKYIGIHFESRRSPVPDEVLEKAHVLDEIIAWPTYGETFEDIWGFPYDGQQGSPKEKFQSQVPAGMPSDRLGKYAEKNQEADVSEPELPASPAETEDEREERELAEKLKAIQDKKKKQQEEEAKKEQSSKSKKEEKKSPEGKCPHKHTFGVDIDSTPDCEKCNAWKECAKECDRLEREQRKS
jgi:hypothetical protein